MFDIPTERLCSATEATANRVLRNLSASTVRTLGGCVGLRLGAVGCMLGLVGPAAAQAEGRLDDGSQVEPAVREMKLKDDLERLLERLRFLDDFYAPVTVPWRRSVLTSTQADPTKVRSTFEAAGRWTRHLSGELSANRWRISSKPESLHTHQATVWDGSMSTSTRAESPVLPADFSVPLSSNLVFDDSEIDGALSSWRGSLGLQYLNISWSDWLDHFGGDFVTPLWREDLNGEDCLAVLFDQAGLVARQSVHPDRLKYPAVVWFEDSQSLLPSRLIALDLDVEMTAETLSEKLTAYRDASLPLESRITYEWMGVARSVSGVTVRERCLVKRHMPIELVNGALGVGEEFRLALEDFHVSQRTAYGKPSLGVSFPALVEDARSKERYYVEEGFERVEISDFDIGMMQSLNDWPGSRHGTEPFQLNRVDYRGATCGPLAVYFAATLLGATEIDMPSLVRSLSATSRAHGVSTLLELKKMSVELQLETRAVECTTEDLKAHGGIAICHMLNGADQNEHFAAVYFMDDGDVVHVGSPPFVTHRMTVTEFEKGWSGRALLIAPP
jgi:hypothetical protein